jgi:phosphomannomutase
MNFRPKLMAFDLDGTLAESKQRVTPQMGGLLSELLSHIPIAILSGAGFQQFEIQFLPAFPNTDHFDRLYLFPTNAAACFTFKNGAWKVVYDRSFNSFEKGRITQAFKESVVEAKLTEPKEIWGERLEDRGAQITFSELGQHAPLEEKEKWHQLHEDERDRLREALVRRLPDFSVLEGGLTTVEVTPKGVSKAYGIRKLIELTGTSVSEMLYVGDALQEGGNDAVVVETGIKTHEVFSPEETAALLRHVIAELS